ncbi:MAG: class I SAM-dependent methyltransferase [Aureispira sp.]
MLFQYQSKDYHFERYPQKENRSLRAWSAVDEHFLRYQREYPKTLETPLFLYNDRFGFLTCLQLPQATHSILTWRSQQVALDFHCDKNVIDTSNWSYSTPLDPLPQSVQEAWIKLPKSLELLQVFLQQLSAQLTPDATVVIGFMTRHFSPQLLSLASLYFEQVEQSKAWKKSRLLILKQPKPYQERTLQHELHWQNQLFKQYYGVFSAKHIDYASQFLLNNLPTVAPNSRVLDVACGNGILGIAATHQVAQAELHLLDDFNLATASAQLNAPSTHSQIHWHYTLEELPKAYFDWVVCNPPFHTEHEITTTIAKQLFRGVQQCLAPDGQFWIVANRHLNYKRFLENLFYNVQITKQNKKFIIYRCKS